MRLFARVLFVAAAFLFSGGIANAQVCNSASGFLKTFGPIQVGNVLILAADCEHAIDGGGIVISLGNPTQPAVNMTGSPGVSTTLAMRADAKLAIDPTISPTMTGFWNFTPSSGASPAITITTLANSFGKGIVLTHPLVSGNTGALALNTFTINTDVANAGSGFIDGAVFQYNFGGTGFSGGREALKGLANLTTALAALSSQNNNFVGVVGIADAQAYAGGTSVTVFANTAGAFFGGNFNGISESGAINLTNVTAAEFNTAMQAGSTAYAKSVVQFVGRGDDAVSGTQVDTMLWSYNQISSTPRFKYWSLIDDLQHNGGFPVSTSGTILLAGSTFATYTVANGIDFSLIAFSQFAWKSPGVTISGAGGFVLTGSGTYGIDFVGSVYTQAIRIANNQNIVARNAANNADAAILDYDGSNNLVVGGSITGNIVAGAGVIPITTNLYTLGGTATRWSTLYGVTIDLGGIGVATGQMIMRGTTSGLLTQTVPAVAGTPTVTWGSGTGTPAVTASAPLVITAATGNIACSPQCLTTSSTLNLVVGTTTIGSGTNLRVLYDANGVLGEYTNTQLTALINVATATLSGALPAWPNNATTFFRGDGTYTSVASAALNITTTSCTNQFVTAISSGGVGACTTDTLASAQHANQGTTTTLLHGNGAGNPSWSAVVSADLSITTTTCTNQFVTAISSGGVGACTTDTLASAQHANQGTTTTLLHGNGAGNPSWSAVSLTADITGTLPVANGGSNCSVASITCFNNITGFTASGTTGTTSTNLVFSASPTITGTLTAATITASAIVSGSSLALSGTTVIQTVGNFLQINSFDGTTRWFVGKAGTETYLRDTNGLYIQNDAGGTTYASILSGGLTVSVGHLVVTGTTPAISSCGTGSPTVSGSDNFGTVVAGTVATTCTINFGATWGATPKCVAASGTAISSMTVTATTTQLTIAGTSLNGDTINWVCGSTASNDNGKSLNQAA